VSPSRGGRDATKFREVTERNDSRSGSEDWSGAKPAATCAHVAQSVERVLGKDEVTSSTLVVGSMKMHEDGRHAGDGSCQAKENRRKRGVRSAKGREREAREHLSRR
jgi:hypothetical protein